VISFPEAVQSKHRTAVAFCAYCWFQGLCNTV